jgi:serine/threonine-protein kinase
MAQVWVARLIGKHGFEKLVAIKAILPKFASDQQFQKMFLDEARIASGIEHANVARTFDLGDEHGVLYLAMEWVDGDALSKLHRALEKKGQGIPAGVLLRVVADTCGGLHAAHELRSKNGTHLGVVHRDVSPHNILVTARGVAKLIDFGIAKARDRGIGETNAGTLKGKIHYMAPEQALGGSIDRRADVWAIGAVLYHMLSGRPPFWGDNQLATLHQLASGKPALPLPLTVPPAVGAVVKRALARDCDRRFATAEELQSAIEQAMVTARLVTTTADVAAFAAQHLAERAKARREAINLALAAAEERARVQELLKVPAPDSSVSDVGVLPAMAQPDREAVVTVQERRTSSPEHRVPTPPSVPTQATLGLAAVESSVRSFPPGNRRRTLVVSAGVVGIVVGILGTVALRGGGPGGERSVAAGGARSAVVGERSGSQAPSAVAAAPAATTVPGASAEEAASAPSETSAAPAGSPPAAVLPAPARTTAPPRATAAPRKIPKVIDNGF